jgi:uncharacterized Zn-finger protein
MLDPDYTGNIGVILFNHNNIEYDVKKHDKIAQIIFEHYAHNVELIEDKVISKSERGNKGFGSTDHEILLKQKAKKTKLVRCEQCNSWFTSWKDLNDHYLSHEKVFLEKLEESFKCEICNEMFSRQDLLTGHYLVHLSENN